MTVKELKEILENYNDNDEVGIELSCSEFAYACLTINGDGILEEEVE